MKIAETTEKIYIVADFFLQLLLYLWFYDVTLFTALEQALQNSSDLAMYFVLIYSLKKKKKKLKQRQ